MVFHASLPTLLIRLARSPAAETKLVAVAALTAFGFAAATFRSDSSVFATGTRAVLSHWLVSWFTTDGTRGLRTPLPAGCAAPRVASSTASHAFMIDPVGSLAALA